MKHAPSLQNSRGNGATWRASIKTLKILRHIQTDPLPEAPRRGGILEPARRNLVISGAFALETERYFYRGSLSGRRRAFRLSATLQDRDRRGLSAGCGGLWQAISKRRLTRKTCRRRRHPRARRTARCS